MIRAAAKTDPAGALRQLSRLALTEGFADAKGYREMRDRVYRRTLRRWAKREPEGAKAFVETLADPEEQAVALKAIAADY